MSMIIENAGALTTVQDLGRRGFLGMGFSPCGALDERAFRLVCALAGNSANEAALEMTLMGITVRFTAPVLIALTGADFDAKLNGAPLALNTAVQVSSGDTLVCGMATRGLRGYLAVSGGIDVPAVMGSRSTYLKCGIGGFAGRKLESGDVLETGKAHSDEIPVPETVIHPVPVDPHSVRAIAGPEDDLFSSESLSRFFTAEFTVSSQCDRMGIRLDGEAIASKAGTDIISNGIAAGSVQVPPSGLPIILLADRQTVGGYAKIATVITRDIPLLAQLRPGDKLHFTRITVQDAQRIDP